MLQPYVELSHNPPSHEIRPLPGGMAIVALYDGAELLETMEDGAQRWRALCYTIAVPNTPNLAQRVAASTAAWLERAKALSAEESAREARARRDKLLKDCDYAVGTDYPATDMERDAWRKYRQALRDIPEHDGFPWDVTWPEPPTREKAADTILGAIDELIGG